MKDAIGISMKRYIRPTVRYGFTNVYGDDGGSLCCTKTSENIEIHGYATFYENIHKIEGFGSLATEAGDLPSHPDNVDVFSLLPGEKSKSSPTAEHWIEAKYDCCIENGELCSDKESKNFHRKHKTEMIDRDVNDGIEPLVDIGDEE